MHEFFEHRRLRGKTFTDAFVPTVAHAMAKDVDLEVLSGDSCSTVQFFPRVFGLLDCAVGTNLVF
jgi:hypothetical protein